MTRVRHTLYERDNGMITYQSELDQVNADTTDHTLNDSCKARFQLVSTKGLYLVKFKFQ